MYQEQPVSDVTAKIKREKEEKVLLLVLSVPKGYYAFWGQFKPKA